SRKYRGILAVCGNLLLCAAGSAVGTTCSGPDRCPAQTVEPCVRSKASTVSNQSTRNRRNSIFPSRSPVRGWTAASSRSINAVSTQLSISRGAWLTLAGSSIGEPNMSKRIVFCADGTWDSPQNKTNVYKIYQAVSVTPDQLPFYDDGVGSDGLPLEHLAGGAFGIGLFQKIKDGYTKIAHAYEQGDDLYIFGFSRGAYTARSLAGMIAICGLPTQPFDASLVNTAFNAYRNRDQRAAL